MARKPRKQNEEPEFTMTEGDELPDEFYARCGRGRARPHPKGCGCGYRCPECDVTTNVTSRYVLRRAAADDRLFTCKDCGSELFVARIVKQNQKGD